MRIKETKVYSFSGLSKEVQEKVIERWRQNEDFSWIVDNASSSLKAFCELFDVNYRTIDYQETYRNQYSVEMDENALALSGQRLATYLWNNYKREIYKGKYYSVESNKVLHHKRVKSKKLSNGKVFNAYYSAIQLEECCVFTGMCYDLDLLQPIYDFMRKPTSSDFEDLINECILSLCKSVSSEIEANMEPESVQAYFDANEYEFLENGVIA